MRSRHFYLNSCIDGGEWSTAMRIWHWSFPWIIPVMGLSHLARCVLLEWKILCLIDILHFRLIIAPQRAAFCIRFRRINVLLRWRGFRPSWSLSPSHLRLLDGEEGFGDSYCSVQMNSRSGCTRGTLDTEGQGSGIVKRETMSVWFKFLSRHGDPLRELVFYPCFDSHPAVCTMNATSASSFLGELPRSALWPHRSNWK